MKVIHFLWTKPIKLSYLKEHVYEAVDDWPLSYLKEVCSYGSGANLWKNCKTAENGFIWSGSNSNRLFITTSTPSFFSSCRHYTKVTKIDHQWVLGFWQKSCIIDLPQGREVRLWTEGLNLKGVGWLGEGGDGGYGSFVTEITYGKFIN